MAYTPINWQTGDTITADKLNRCDNGWGYEDTLLFSETVTTADTYSEGYGVGELSYSQFINSPTIVVTFDGVDYTCPNTAPSSLAEVSGTYGASLLEQGGYDFSDYPFAIDSYATPFGTFGNGIYTETIGTHTITVAGSAIVTSSDFDTAAQTAVAPSIAAIPTPYLVTVGTTTMQEVFDAIGAGKIPIIVYNDGIANSPRYIEVVLYARKYNLTVSSVTISDGSVTVKNYTASNANSPIVLSS